MTEDFVPLPAKLIRFDIEIPVERWFLHCKNFYKGLFTTGPGAVDGHNKLRRAERPQGKICEAEIRRDMDVQQGG